MSFPQTLERLRALKLLAMAQSFEEQRANSAMQSLNWEEHVALAVDAEVQARENRRIANLRKKANLKSPACFEDIDFNWPRKLDRQVILSLKSCAFVEKSLNVIFISKTGLGKSWLGKMLCEEAIRKGFTAKCFRLEPLLLAMEIARADGSLLKMRADLAKTKVLMLDDWGMPPLSARGRHDLMEVIEDRTESGATIITTQLPIDKWHDFIGDPTVADAILDRLIHRAYRIEMDGPSMRTSATNVLDELKEAE